MDKRPGLLSALALLSILVAGPLAAQTTTPQGQPPTGQPAPQPPAAKPAAPPTAAPQPGPPVADDHSLTADAYRAKGLPAVEKPWTDVDYAAAVKALEGLMSDPTQLPRHGSPTSGAVFARLVSTDNFEPLTKKRRLADERLTQAGRYGNAINQLLNIYARAVNQTKKTFDAELIDLTLFNLQFADQLRTITDQLVEEVTNSDPQADARRQIRDRTRYSFAALIDSALSAFPQHRAYRTAELVRFANGLAGVMPKLYPVLPGNAKRDLPARIEELAGAEQDPALKEAILGIKAKLG